MLSILLILELIQLALSSPDSMNGVVLKPIDVNFPQATVQLTDKEWQKLVKANKPQIDYPNATTIQQPLNAGKTSNNAVNAYIIGGTRASLGQIPWQAFIYINNVSLCGGSLIVAQWILTAAHCIGFYFQVVLGSISRSNLSPGFLWLYTNTAFRHEAWNPSTLNNDIALIKLNAPVTFTANISPIKLPPISDATKTFEGVFGMISGFGKTGDYTSPSNDLMSAKVMVISYQSCAAYYGTKIVVSSTICTQQIAGQGTCNGDSGGPLAYLDSTNSWVLIGVVSFGSSKGCLAGPSGFARVTSFLGWISDKIAKNSDTVPTTTTRAITTTKTTTRAVITTRRTTRRTTRFGQQEP